MAGISRRTQFEPSREPLRQEPTLQLKKDRVTGAIPFLNPTQARYTRVRTAGEGQQGGNARPNDSAPAPVADGEKAAATADALPSNIEYTYTSRNNRKGRHVLVVTPTDLKDDSDAAPRSTTSPKAVSNGLWRMCTYFPYWDVSWLVAVSFTIGSIVWVINSFFIFLPLHEPATKFEGEVLYGGGITAFIGATIFEIGSIFLVLEAVNENRAGCFGWAVEKLWNENDDEVRLSTKVVPVKDSCTHHHQNTGNLIGKPSAIARQSTKTEDIDPTPPGDRSWTWWPTTTELRTHYFHDLGFLACLVQFLAATVFWVSGFTALPGILNKMSHPLIAGIYWTPQVIGGLGFVISGWTFMLETQKHWWKPAFGVLGWWIGFFNWIGGWGFLLCPCFGYDKAAWAQYQAAVATFWGSWAFLVGSFLQWYESLEKHPVTVEKAKGV